ncbi:hypothetical protein [Streptomyces sp. NPDC047009]|uniref:hypothetical protein n=1 Tax=Streptomyces sp. NPDC047009 TaxID=3154496 RepID=UPI0033E33C55
MLRASLAAESDTTKTLAWHEAAHTAWFDAAREHAATAERADGAAAFAQRYAAAGHLWGAVASNSRKTRPRAICREVCKAAGRARAGAYPGRPRVVSSNYSPWRWPAQPGSKLLGLLTAGLTVSATVGESSIA